MSEYECTHSRHQQLVDLVHSSFQFDLRSVLSVLHRDEDMKVFVQVLPVRLPPVLLLLHTKVTELTCSSQVKYYADVLRVLRTQLHIHTPMTRLLYVLIAPGFVIDYILQHRCYGGFSVQTVGMRDRIPTFVSSSPHCTFVTDSENLTPTVSSHQQPAQQPEALQLSG